VEVTYTFSIVPTLINKLYEIIKMYNLLKKIITSFGGAFGVEDNSSSNVVISRVGCFDVNPHAKAKMRVKVPPSTIF